MSSYDLFRFKILKYVTSLTLFLNDDVFEDVEKVSAAPEVPRSFVIKQSDLENHGYSEKCMGCKARLRGTARQAHSNECRSRLSKAMASSEKVKMARQREN